MFAFAYVRAVSSTPLIVYAALVTSVPPLIVRESGSNQHHQERNDADDDQQFEKRKSISLKRTTNALPVALTRTHCQERMSLEPLNFPALPDSEENPELTAAPPPIPPFLPYE